MLTVRWPPDGLFFSVLPSYLPPPPHSLFQDCDRFPPGRRGEWWTVRTDLETRACDLAMYIIEHDTTVRAAAKRFGVSKSTVHQDLTRRLPEVNRPLYLQVKAVMDRNKAERHIRGGMATREKYRKRKKRI